MSPFDPISDQARWKIVYELLRCAATDTIVTYDELGKALGLDPQNQRHAIQMATRRAAMELEVVDKRAIDAVPNKGYRIMPAPENLGLARRHQRKAGRSLQRGHSKTVNVDLTGIDPEVRHALEVMAQAFALQTDYNQRFTVRQSELEAAVREITDTQGTDRRRSAYEIARLQERIERLERGA